MLRFLRIFVASLILSIVLGLSLASVLSQWLPAASAKYLTVVKKVHDGDTLTLDSDPPVRVRLTSIDAPELGQPFGQDSRQYLQDLVWGKCVTVYPQGRDRYRRLLAEIWTDGNCVNEAMVASGLAWAYMVRDEKYKLLESQAREQRAGLWIDDNPHPPWVFRANKRRLIKSFGELVLPQTIPFWSWGVADGYKEKEAKDTAAQAAQEQVRDCSPGTEADQSRKEEKASGQVRLLSDLDYSI